MAYAMPFLRLVCSGTLYDAERFSYGLTLINDFGTGEPPSEVPQAVIDAVVTFHDDSTAVSPFARLDTIKLNEIGTNGRYTSDDDTVLHELETSVAGGGGVNYPPQVALAISLRTGRARGRAHAGRFYVPAGVGIGGDGRMTPANQTAILAQATSFISALNSAVPGYDVGVVSGVGTGRQSAVTHVRLGRVLDTIRSRRTSMDEAYVDGPPIVEEPAG